VRSGTCAKKSEGYDQEGTGWFPPDTLLPAKSRPCTLVQLSYVPALASLTGECVAAALAREDDIASLRAAPSGKGGIGGKPTRFPSDRNLQSFALQDQ